MKHIFYFIGILFIIHECIWLMNPKSQCDKSKKLHEALKLNKNKKYDERTPEFKEMEPMMLIILFIWLWLLSGLMTFNWPVFLIFILWNIAIITPIGKLLKYNLGYIILHWFNSLIGFAFGVFIILNSYHFKINIYDMFLRLINKN